MADRTKEILEAVGEVKSDIKDLDSQVLDVKEKVHEIEKVVIKNTESLDTHIKRTDTLESILIPLRDQNLQEKAVEEYKKQARMEFIQKLKVPGMILGLLISAGTVLAWVLGAF